MPSATEFNAVNCAFHICGEILENGAVRILTALGRLPCISKEIVSLVV